MVRKQALTNLIAEFVGTFLLVFIGSFSAIIHKNDPLNSGICILQLYVFLTYALYTSSGAHFNPAISLYHLISKEFHPVKGLMYIAVQFAASLIGGAMVWILIPPTPYGEKLFLGQPTIQTFVGTNTNVVNYFQAFSSEQITSAFLIFIFRSSYLDRSLPPNMHGAITGGFYGVTSIALGRITGGSMNPARSLGPALFCMDFWHMPIYVIAPIFGVIIGGYYYDSFYCDLSKKAVDFNNYNLEVLNANDLEVSET